MTEQFPRRRRGVPAAVLAATAALAALATAAALLSAPDAGADPLGASGAGKGAPAPAAPRVSDAGCTLSPSLTVKSEIGSCIGVGATLSAVPALGQTATLTVTVKAGRVETATKVAVDLPSTLAFADGTTTTAAVNGTGAARRATLATVDLTAGATRTFTRTVKAVGTGAGEIAATATSVVSEGRVDGGADHVHLTVGKDATTSAVGIGAPTGDQATAAASAPVSSAKPDRPSVALPAATVPGQRANAVAGPGTTCASGSWVFVDQNGTTVGAYQTVVQVWRGGSIVASGYALGSGAYSLCWASGGGTNTVSVRFVESNNAWKVVTNAGNDFAYATGTQNLADGATGDFGYLQPADGTQHRALHAYYNAAVTFDWIYQSATYGSGCWSPFATSCRQLVIHWQSDSTSGPVWNTSGVYLPAASPDSEDESVHEYGHALMYGLYADTFPATTNCSPHYLMGASSTTCAWTEGFADWVPISVWGNTVYTFPAGNTLDFNRTWNDGYDTGDAVEGRIVQALASLNDGTKYPFDNLSGPGYRRAEAVFAVMRNSRPSTMSAYWSGRAAVGQDVGQGSLSALYQGTIDYGFRNPLADDTGKAMPQAAPAHAYSFATTRGYWSAVAVRPVDGSDVDMALFTDAGLATSLGSSGYGGSAVDFVAVNSNSGGRALQTYYPRVNQFSGAGGYTVAGVQGSSTFSIGTVAATTSSSLPVGIRDTYQNSGVPVYYRAVPAAGQSLGLTFLQPGQTVLSRGSGVNSAIGTAGAAVSLVATPTATGYGGLVLVNQGMTSGGVTLYADTTASADGAVTIAGGAAATHTKTVSLALAATDAETGVVSMQISTDGTFDTETVVPYSTTASTVLAGANGTKTVSARFLNNAGIWSAPVSDTIAFQVSAQVTTVTPTAGPTAGGTKITLKGVRFTGTTRITVDGVDATNVVVASDTKVVAKVPAHAAGAVTVRVVNAYGTSNPVTFTYVSKPTVTKVTPSSGPAAGGTSVTVTGTNLTGATAVMFGNAAGTNVVVVSSTKITVTSPNHAVGTVDVLVTTAGGTSAPKVADRYRFT